MLNFLLYGPLLQFDIAERSFTCLYDLTYLIISVSDFDLAVLAIILVFLVYNLSEYYNNQVVLRPSLKYSPESMVIDLISEKNYNVFDLINMVFVSIFLANFSGLIPYSQTITSQLLVTIILSLILMFGIWFQGFFFNKIFFWSHFLPSGSPLVIIPFIILIELVSNASRIISLSVRLFANMTSGHALLKILSGFALVAFSMLFFWKILIIFPVLIIVIITALEMLIAFLQTYVLVTLVLIYTGEQE